MAGPDLQPGAVGVPPALVFEDVCITYRVYEDRRVGVRDYLRKGLAARPRSYIPAVQGVTLTIAHGEAVGLVGSNGAGKSTLLRGAAGLLPVTSGRIRARSTPSFLGVGAALKPKLSGRRNIYLGCLALGLTKAEIDARYDEIVEFTGLRKSIDRPLKTYSSGMKSRLQFAIATSTEPDILLIDEALAVGDRKFKRRSAEKIDAIRSHSGTVVLVSHSLAEIERSCDRVIWLEEGQVRADGPTAEILERYRSFQDD
jgi:teichoic acid transport system ATP-binding protein